MAGKPVNSGLCKGCGRRVLADPPAACPRCGGRRIIAHPDLFSLTIAHLDCDAFYAAIEKRDDPALADRPVIVGGGARGVVTTACYVARTYGVRSAMPMFKALKACPGAVVIKPDFRKYAEAARAVRTLLESVTPLVEVVSIDEAFLDLSGTERLHAQSAAETLLDLQRAIKRDVGITVSVGLSVNKFLAKLASDLDKPNGFSVIGGAEARAVLAPMPASAIFGVGAALAQKLAQDGFRTIGDLQRAAPGLLAARYGVRGERLARLSMGQDSRRVAPAHETKSVSSESTFNEDISDLAGLEAILWRLCERTAARMKSKGLAGRTAALKLKTAAFEITTRSRRLPEASNLARTLFEALQPLLADQARGAPYRLIGAGYSDLEQAPQSRQASLFPDRAERLRKEEEAMDAIRGRFGEGAIALGRGLAARGAAQTSDRRKAPPDGSN